MKRLAIILALLGAPVLCAQGPLPRTPQEMVTKPFTRPDARGLLTQQVTKTVEPLPVAPTNAPVRERVIVVDLRGADANAGTAAAPVRTLQRAAQLAQPGDTVLVRPGIYAGFKTVRGGRKGEPITFQAQGEVIVNSCEPAAQDHIVVRATDWVTVAGFTVRDAPRAGITVLDASHCVISNNVVGPNKMWGIFTGFAPQVEIVGNRVFGSEVQHGIYVSNSRVADDRPVLRGNECYANAASGIQLNGDCNMGGDGVIQGALIEGNILHDNDSKPFSLISIADSVIQNNLLFNNGRKSGAGGIHLTDELGCGKGSRNNLVVNNTIVEPRIAAMRFTDNATGNVVFNNLIVGRGIVDEVGRNQVDSESNVVVPAATSLFVNAAKGDYRLQPGAVLRTGKTTFAGRDAPDHDISGALRNGLTRLLGACDAQCGALPVPGEFDAAVYKLWRK